MMTQNRFKNYIMATILLSCLCLIKTPKTASGQEREYLNLTVKIKITTSSSFSGSKSTSRRDYSEQGNQTENSQFVYQFNGQTTWVGKDPSEISVKSSSNCSFTASGGGQKIYYYKTVLTEQDAETVWTEKCSTSWTYNVDNSYLKKCQEMEVGQVVLDEEEGTYILSNFSNLLLFVNTRGKECCEKDYKKTGWKPESTKFTRDINAELNGHAWGNASVLFYEISKLTEKVRLEELIKSGQVTRTIERSIDKPCSGGYQKGNLSLTYTIKTPKKQRPCDHGHVEEDCCPK